MIPALPTSGLVWSRITSSTKHLAETFLRTTRHTAQASYGQRSLKSPLMEIILYRFLLPSPTRGLWVPTLPPSYPLIRLCMRSVSCWRSWFQFWILSLDISDGDCIFRPVSLKWDESLICWHSSCCWKIGWWDILCNWVWSSRLYNG